jgi:hypothetical protein
VIAMLLILLIVLVLCSYGGGFYGPEAYRGPGIGVGTLLLVLLLVLIFSHALGPWPYGW